MRVRVTAGARYSTIQLFSGMEFVKSEWRPVPSWYEAEALKSGWLEIEPAAPVVKKLVPIPVPIEEPLEEEVLPLPINSFMVEEVEWVDAVAEMEAEPVPEPVKKAKRAKGGK
jgi:hypothetical protein